MGDAAHNAKFKREHVRAQVVPTKISGMLTIAGADMAEQVPFLIWDVSPKGIGLMATKNIPVGTKVTVTIGQPYVMILECSINWCAPHGDEGYRCGLEVIVSESKLKSLYAQFCKNAEEV